MTTHSSMLAWEILWTEEPGRLQSMGSQRVRHDWATGHEHTNTWYFDNSSIMLKKRRPLRTGLAAGLEGEMLVRHTPVQYSPKINFVPNSPLHMMSCLPVSPLGRHFYPQFAGAETQGNEAILWVNLRAKIQAHIRPAPNHAFPISPGCYACMLSRLSHVWLCEMLWTIACQAPLWDSSGENTGVGCHVLLQGIFPTWGSNLHLLCLLHWQGSSLPLSYWGSPLPFCSWYLFMLQIHHRIASF